MKTITFEELQKICNPEKTIGCNRNYKSTFTGCLQENCPEWCLLQSVTELPPPRGEDENKCEWRWDTDGFWHTNCGGSFTLNTGDLKQNEFNYCHKCGRKIYEMYPVEPAAPVAPAVESKRLEPAIVQCIWLCPGCQTFNGESDILCKRCNTARQPAHCPSCEKLKGENEELTMTIDKAAGILENALKVALSQTKE